MDEAASATDVAGRAFLSVDRVLMQCLFTFSLNLLSIFFLCFVLGCYCCIKFICVSSNCSLLGTLTLPESSNLLSVFMFAECISSDTRRTSPLPCAALKTLGKKNTRQREGLSSVKKNTRQRNKIFFLEKKEKKKFEKKNFTECSD